MFTVKAPKKVAKTLEARQHEKYKRERNEKKRKEEEELEGPVKRCEGFTFITFMMALIAGMAIGISYLKSYVCFCSPLSELLMLSIFWIIFHF